MTIDEEAPRLEKSERRRLDLAESALKTLGELGYARTSLREIAANSEFSHGVVHYYFRDKSDLISYCVRYYKTICSKRYDEVIEKSASAEELAEGFLDKMTETLVEETALHRLWYDLRSQSMFEESVREDVAAIDTLLQQMIWRILSRYAELSGGLPTVGAFTAYGVIDGLFEQAVLAVSVNSEPIETIVENLRTGISRVVPLLVAS